MKKFDEQPRRIRALLIAIIISTVIFANPITIVFLININSTYAGVKFQELSKVPLPKVYETMGSFKKYKVLEANDDQDFRYMTYRLVRIQFLSDKAATNFEEEIQAAKEWQPISSLSSDERMLLKKYNANAENAYYVANGRPLDSDDLRFILYNFDTHEIIFLLLN